MSGVVVARAVLVANSGVTNLVPASRIIGDDVPPQATALPLILLKQVSSVDHKKLVVGNRVMRRERVQCEVHASTAIERQNIKAAVRKAVQANTFPTVSGLHNVTIHNEAEGPDFFIEEASVRVGEQDFNITFSEDVS